MALEHIMAASTGTLVLATAALVALNAQPASAAKFVFTDLMPPGEFETPTVVGVYQDQAIGWAYTSGGMEAFVWSAGIYTYLPGIANITNVSDTGLALGNAQGESTSSYVTYDMASGVTANDKFSPTGDIFNHGGINAVGTIVATQLTPIGKNGKKGYRYRPFEQAPDGTYTWLAKQQTAPDEVFAVGLFDNGTAVLKATSTPGSGYLIAKDGKHKPFSIPNSSGIYVEFVSGAKFGGNFTDAKTKHAVGFVSDGSKVVTYSAPSPATDTIVSGLGPRGTVIGYSIDPSHHSTGFIFAGGKYHPVQHPGSDYTYPLAMSSTGAIVGTYLTGDLGGSFIATCPSQKVCTD